MIDYEEYLQSPEWREKRARRIEIDGCRCSVCGSPYDLQVHHKSYKNLGNEDVDSDLITLCEDCHYALHDITKSFKSLTEEQKNEYKRTATALIKPAIDKYCETTATILTLAVNQFMNDRDLKQSSTMFVTSLIYHFLKMEPGGIAIRASLKGDELPYQQAIENLRALRGGRK